MRPTFAIFTSVARRSAVLDRIGREPRRGKSALKGSGSQRPRRLLSLFGEEWRGSSYHPFRVARASQPAHR